MQDCGKSSTLINLRVLSQVQPGDRVRGDGQFIEIEQRSVLTFLVRWWRQDTREKTLIRIATLMSDACKYNVPQNLIAEAMQGVQVMAETTYKSDPLTVARLKTICAQVDCEIKAPRRRSF